MNEAPNKFPNITPTTDKWFLTVKPGDKVLVHPDWNRTEPPPKQLQSPTTVIDVIKSRSQSGILFVVKTKNGSTRSLDAGWFTGLSDETQERDT